MSVSGFILIGTCLGFIVHGLTKGYVWYKSFRPGITLNPRLWYSKVYKDKSPGKYWSMIAMLCLALAIMVWAEVYGEGLDHYIIKKCFGRK